MAFWIWATIGVLALVRFVQACISKTKNKMLPPGPRGFPIFGSLHLLGKFPTMDLRQLAQKYGDIMYLRLGLQHTVVVSSARAAELFLKTHDLNFASRPPNEGAKHLIFGQKSLSFAEYGSYWTNMRKICMLELLSNQKINSFKSMRREEVALLIKSVQEDANNRRISNLTDKVMSLGIDMTCRMLFGKKYKDEEFGGRGIVSVMKEGLTKKMKAVNNVFDDFYEKIIDEHLQSKDTERTKDFTDAILAYMGSEESDYRIERLNIKAMMSDMLVASADTSSTTVLWALSELMRHPQVMKKVQKEIENVVGLNRMVEESDTEKLEYLDMVVKETMRLHPVDPSAWEDAEKFVPERFEDSNVYVRGHHFQILPFGSGRRRCVGMQLGITVVHFLLAQLVHCFDWELPDNMLPNELDMTEEFGLAVSRAKNLLAIPSYRLQN
ncbi:cytochrome P450 CYP736A12-like [Pyrus ussuriensis x Pyrus communis]|uniref:Cytochrome P450 CYP736A12-like n=1 Tax=Pyrus ussuriensis x Pyrus communis TaxID=2448454 RepID=A0A5N5FQM6_9ROSA|nr:cytochrome P450 CYP736A12-like [Pyrus ussuriensis x Pyrus communis]